MGDKQVITLIIRQKSGRILHIAALFFIILISTTNNLSTEISTPTQSDNTKVFIAILYNTDETGTRHMEVIKDKLEEEILIKYDLFPYSEDNDGLEQLKGLMNKEQSKYDIILGLTESDIFIHTTELEEELSTKKVTVISGLVTSETENDNKIDGWFFRTNVDTTRRVQTIIKFLKRYWISSINVVYEDSEYGRRAERAFKEALGSRFKAQRYTSYLFNTFTNSYQQLEKIVKDRPEAIGIFCQREEITPICKEIKELNYSGSDYDPLVFTIIDISSIAGNIGDIYFVSLNEMKDKMMLAKDFEKNDDVIKLGTDLGRLVISALGDMKQSGGLGIDDDRMMFREKFRDQLANVMQAGENKDEPTINFVKFSNTTLPKVYRLTEGEEITPIIIEGHVNWFKKTLHKIGLVIDVFGFWIPLTFLVIFIIAFFISRMEVKRYFPSKHIKIYKTKVFFLFLFGHIITVLVIVIFLAESGRMNYNDILMVILISMTPTAFLRTTFFETKYGRSIGLENIYKNLMSSVENKIMHERYKYLEATVNMIAYYNGEDAMKKALFHLYKRHPSAIQQAKLIQKLEEDLATEQEYLNRRRICAKHLMKQFDREQLKAEGFIPKNWDFDNPFDPKLIVRKIAKYCSSHPKRIDDIDNMLIEQLNLLNKRSPKKYQEICDFKEHELKNIVGVESELVVKLRLLFILMAGVDIHSFEKEFLSTEEGDAGKNIKTNQIKKKQEQT